MRSIFLYLFILLTTGFNFGQIIDVSYLDQLTTKYINNSIDELHEFLSIPNDSHYKDHIENNIAWIEKAFQKRDFKTTIIPTPGNPYFFAEKQINKSYKTILFYIHLDGQPVDSTKWDQESPYKPVLKQKDKNGNWSNIDWSILKSKPDKELRIFCRSSSDDKSPIIMFLTAIDIIHAENLDLKFNIKVILDGEEEISSPNLPLVVDNNYDLLKSDMMIIYDGPRHYTNRPTIFFGCRGITSLDLTVFGPRTAQHSGHFGNYAPNPALRLSQLLSSMKDEKGKVTIPGFYDGIKLDGKTLEILAGVPDDPNELNEKLGIAESDQVGTDYQHSLQYPSLNIHGLSSGWIGKEARTIIPPTATACIDIRLVVESDPDRLINLIKNHIKGKGYYIVNKEPTDEERKKYDKIILIKYSNSNMAFRTDFDSEIGKWTTNAMTRAFGEEPVRIRTIGGTVPISQFVQKLNINAVIVTLVNLDNNQHGPNENLRFGNYIDGIKTCLSILVK